MRSLVIRDPRQDEVSGGKSEAFQSASGQHSAFEKRVAKEFGAYHLSADGRGGFDCSGRTRRM